ncbi:MAG: hypothetical protein DRI32_07110 [Chloroflexi bacterium]|nr:MAG: hypothetical protein DRI32_07110 [Chloroflexota bacterium]
MKFSVFVLRKEKHYEIRNTKYVFRITIFRESPYKTINELCEMDAALLEECLGQRVEQIEKLAGEGIRFCVFGVR